MNAYIFQAALLCEDCAEQVRRELEVPIDPGDERTWDSDDYPKGPYPDGGGESDYPQHCDHCDAFLENPLTAEGEAYVREALEESAEDPTDIEAEWSSYYGIPIPGAPHEQA